MSLLKRANKDELEDALKEINQILVVGIKMKIKKNMTKVQKIIDGKKIYN